jgi:hypothetical protein
MMNCGLIIVDVPAAHNMNNKHDIMELRWAITSVEDAPERLGRVTKLSLRRCRQDREISQLGRYQIQVPAAGHNLNMLA